MDLICQSALVVSGAVSSGKSTAAAIALAASLYGRRAAFFGSTTPLAASGSIVGPTRTLTGSVMALVLVSSRETEDLWKGLLDRLLRASFDRSSAARSQGPSTIVGTSILHHASATCEAPQQRNHQHQQSQRSSGYPNAACPVVIVQNVFQLDGLGRLWGNSNREAPLTSDVGGMPLGFLNSVETLVIDGVEAILTPPLSATIPLGIFTLLRRLGQRAQQIPAHMASSSSREELLEKQRSLPYTSRSGFTSMWLLTAANSCSMLGSGAVEMQSSIGYSSGSSGANDNSNLKLTDIDRFYVHLQQALELHHRQSGGSGDCQQVVQVDYGACCDVLSGRHERCSSRLLLTPLMAGGIMRNLARLVGGLLGRGAMLECGQVEDGRWHSIFHKVDFAKTAKRAPHEDGTDMLAAPSLPSLIASALSSIAKGTTVVAVRNKNDATALSTIVRLILAGEMRMPKDIAFPDSYWRATNNEPANSTNEGARVLMFPVGGRHAVDNAKNLASNFTKLKASLRLSGDSTTAVSAATVRGLKEGAHGLLSAAICKKPDEGEWISALEYFDRNVVFLTEWHLKTGSFPKRLEDVRHVISCLWDVTSYRQLLPPPVVSSSSGRGGPRTEAPTPTGGSQPQVSFDLEGLTQKLSHLFGSHAYLNRMTTIVALESCSGGVATAALSSSAGNVFASDELSGPSVGAKRERDSGRGEVVERNRASDMLVRLGAFLQGTKKPIPEELFNTLEDISMGL